jgi:hypothetical protein
MKRIIISLILSLVVVAAMAQTNQYPGTTGTITKSGYTYKYRNDQIFVGEEYPDMLELYNTANRFVDVERGYKDGSKMSFEKFMGEDDTPEFSSASQKYNQTLAMVDACFTSQQKAMLKGEKMSVWARFDTSTGKIAGVHFTFFRNGPFMKIPVETYRSIELALKQNLTITPTAEGRRLNYIQLYWSQQF